MCMCGLWCVVRMYNIGACLYVCMESTPTDLTE